METLLDMRTLMMVITLVMYCRAFFLAYVWRITKGYLPVSLWARGSILMALGGLAIGLRGFLPDSVSIILAQSFLLTGWLIIDGGITLAAGKIPPWRAGMIITVLAVAAIFWYSLVKPDFFARTLATTVASVAFDLYAISACIRFNDGKRRTSFLLLAGILLVMVLSNLLKLVFIAENNVEYLFFDAWQMGQFYLVAVAATLGSSILFVLLPMQHYQEKLDAEILSHKDANSRIELSEKKYRALFVQTSDAVMTLNNQRFIGCNPATLRMFGCQTEEEFCRYSPAELSPPQQPCGTDSSELAQRYIQTAMVEKKFSFEWVHRRVDNGEIFDAEVHLSVISIEGETTLQATVSDITERKRMVEAVRQLGLHDALTQLPNRRLLMDHISMAMAAGKRKSVYGCLLFLDLDNFKSLNDTHGHDMGDLLLIEVAHRLKTAVRSMDTVARLGGDEFVVLIAELSSDKPDSRSIAENVANKILALLSLPYVLQATGTHGAGQTVEHRCTASIGGEIFLGDNFSVAEILKHADIAMYNAKQSGRNTVKFFQVSD